MNIENGKAKCYKSRITMNIENGKAKCYKSTEMTKSLNVWLSDELFSWLNCVETKDGLLS